MNLIYPDVATEINLDEQTVTIKGEVQSLRPITFHFLSLLVKAQGNSITTKRLVAGMGSDQAYNEEKLKQSINEINSLFSEIEVITHDEELGYAWLPQASNTEVLEAIKTAASSEFRFLPLVIAFVTIVTTLFVLSHFFIVSKPSSPSEATTIVVLPVQSDIAANDYEWVQFGLMEQVIAQLDKNTDAKVIPSTDVWDLMSQAELTLDAVFAGEVEPLFEVSSANLVLSMRLTGSPDDYQIVYSIYQKDSMRRGVVLDQTLQGAAEQVAKEVSE